MKTSVLLIVAFMVNISVPAQSYTLNWASSFTPAWANGATSGNAFNIGGSGVQCNINIVKSGGVFASSGGISAPTVTYSYVTVPGSGNNLMLAIDYSSPTQYTDITFTFSAAVYNLSFNLADIDRLTNTSNNYFDRVNITGTIGTSSVLPNITKYDATTDPNFLSVSGNVAKVNTASGMAGNTASDATDQKGTIKVNFTGQIITSFTIRYDNVPGVAADPGLQFIGIGNIQFNMSFPMATELTSFEGKRAGGKNYLNWKTTRESGMAYYAIERSETGNAFNEIGRAASGNSNDAPYSFIDKAISSNSYYYRLRIVNSDGSFTYSKVVLVSNGAEDTKVFPSVFSSSLTIHLSSLKKEPIQIRMTDLSGRTVFERSYNLNEGLNELQVQPSLNLARGQYFLVLGNKNKSFGVIKQ